MADREPSSGALTWAVVDRDLAGPRSVLMLLDEQADADAIVWELRRRGIAADMRQVRLPADD